MTATESDAAPEPRPIATFRPTRSIAARTIAVSVVAFFGFAYAFGRLRGAIRGEPFEPVVVPAVAPSAVLDRLVVALALVALVVVLHELLHGLFMARYGGTPSFGVGVSTFLLPYAYAATGGTSYTRNQLLVALLAPFVCITAAGIAAMAILSSTLLVVVLAANAAGSVGDLRMAAALARYPATVRVAELPRADAQGIAIYGAPDAAGDRGPRWDALASIVTGTVGTLVLGTATLGALVFHALAVGTGDVVVGGDGWVLFRHELRPDGTARLELGARLLLAVAIAGGLAWAAIDRVRRFLV
ncbi:DUF3267 domain-containing protein [Halosolutus amylolyticus]|uniref:DUF3267 domain-containing protein n=1 Tax=Halosolutus amylolyticus TaxID=2932267 RepID=A0ABD5PVQ9_9EURY|nr:DUF3267 domain-containing protein [Halosolutus amylolyticus]